MWKMLIQNDAATAIFTLSLVISVGLGLSKIKVKGVSLGTTWILFAGILLGHLGFTVNPVMLTFVKDFGLILFVFAIGLQVGPGFFQSFRKDGVSMNLLSLGLILLGVLATYVIHYLSGEPLDIMTGIMSGAVTNTPGLGAAQQTLIDAGASDESVSGIASAYAVSYPLGVLGAIAVLLLSKVLFRVDIDKEKERSKSADEEKSSAYRMACVVENPAIFGKSVHDIVGEDNTEHVVVSRMIRYGQVFFPDLDMPLQEGDMLLIVTDQEHRKRVRVVFGGEVPVDMSQWHQEGDKLVTGRLSITKSSITGKSLRKLDIRRRYGVTVTRIMRAGLDL